MTSKLYVRSTTGNDANAGSSWAAAKATLQNASQSDNFDFDVYVSQAHSETTAATIFFAWGGLTNSPVRVICGSDSNEPPVSATNTAKVTVTGANSEIQCNGPVYMYGINLINSGTATCQTWCHDNNTNAQLFENCTFEVNSKTCARLLTNSQDITSGHVRWRNVGVKFAGTADAYINTQHDKFHWFGGSMLSGSKTPQPGLFRIGNGRYSDIALDGIDFSTMDPSFYMVNATGCARFVMRNCRLPSGWTGGFYSGALDFGFRGEMYNCDYGATNIRVMIQEHMGKVVDESTIVKATGASDGVNAYSLKYSANGNCNAAYGRLAGPELNVWNDLTSATLSMTLDILHDNVTGLSNRDVALDVFYLGASASPLGSIGTSAPSDPLTAVTTLVSSSSTWVTTGLTNPCRQKVTVSFTPMQRGFVQARVVQMKDSYTLYVDPKLTVV